MNSYSYNALSSYLWTITALAALALTGCASGAVYWGSPSVDEQVLALEDMPDPPLKRPARERRTAKATDEQEPQTPGSRRTPSTAKAPSDSRQAEQAATTPKREAGKLGGKMSDLLRGSEASPEMLAKLKEAEAEIDSDIKLADSRYQKLLDGTMNDVVKRLEGIKDAPTAPDTPEAKDMTEAPQTGIVNNKHFKQPAADAQATTVNKPSGAGRRLPEVKDQVTAASQESSAELIRKYGYANTGAGKPTAGDTSRDEAAPAAIHQLASTLDITNPLRSKVPQATTGTKLPNKLDPPTPSYVDYSVKQATHVQRDAAEEPVPGAWKEQVRTAIAEMQREIKHREKTGKKISGQAEAEEEIKLRILYLLLGNRQLAFAEFDTMNEQRQQYWQQQLYALDAHFNPKGSPLHDQRAATALRYLRQSVAHLSALSRLEVRNLQFCTQVDSFGRFTTFKKNEFKPNQEVLLYAEIDSFQSNTSEKGGFQTKLQGSYEIFNLGGQRVADFVYPVDEEHCTSRHRDFFVPFRVYMPKHINPGEYIMKLTVEDKLAEKFGQAEIKFKIVP